MSPDFISHRALNAPKPPKGSRLDVLLPVQRIGTRTQILGSEGWTRLEPRRVPVWSLPGRPRGLEIGACSFGQLLAGFRQLLAGLRQLLPGFKSFWPVLSSFWLVLRASGQF